MFGYELIFIKVWSGNKLLIPCENIRDSIKHDKTLINHGEKYRFRALLETNKYKNYKYRLLPKIVKI